MNEKLDEILKQVLIPQENPGDILNGKVLHAGKEAEHMKQKKKRRVSAAVATAVLAAMTSLTVFAAYHFKNAAKVAEELGDKKVAEQFESLNEQPEEGYESQTYGGYEVTYLGMISGENLSKYERKKNGELRTDRTYIAVAIRREDGAPVDEEQETFFVSPLIGSLNPVEYNAVSLWGNYGECVEDGVLYRLMECENMEYFADQNLYLCVTDTTFYQGDLYEWSEAEGSITRNEEYRGLNALFTLKMDASKADPEKAQQLLADMKEAGEKKETAAEPTKVLEWRRRSPRRILRTTVCGWKIRFRL